MALLVTGNPDKNARFPRRSYDPCVVTALMAIRDKVVPAVSYGLQWRPP